MALYPIKWLKDENNQKFMPFVTADSVLVSGTDESIADVLAQQYTADVIDAMFATLGTVMRFKGIVATPSDLPTVADLGDVYLVGSGDMVGYIKHEDGWEDIGKLVDLSAYATTSYVDTKAGTALQDAKDYTDTKTGTTLQSAKTYADSKDATTLQDAKNYADTKQAPLVSGTSIKTVNNKSLLGAGNIDVSAEVDNSITQLTGTTLTLTADKKYKVTITNDTTFVLPTITDGKFHQILVFTTVTGNPTINWGTTKFFNKQIPNVADRTCNVFFEYDGTDWVMGAIAKGAVT